MPERVKGFSKAEVQQWNKVIREILDWLKYIAIAVVLALIIEALW